MANEAVLRDRLEDPIDFTVDNATGIEKGAILQLLDPRTASGAVKTAVGVACAGIAAREKVASDGRTRLSIYRRGIFDVHASGAIAIGEPCILLGNNDVGNAVTAASGAVIIGHALETAADNETFQIQLTLS